MLRCLWDNSLEYNRPTPNKGHQKDATMQRPRPHPQSLRRSLPGGQCRADPTGRPFARMGLGELANSRLYLRDAPGRASPGDNMLTFVASALAGGDCIDDADSLHCSGTARVLGCTVKAPSTLGTSLRIFRWGHAGQVNRELLSRACSEDARLSETRRGAGRTCARETSRDAYAASQLRTAPADERHLHQLLCMLIKSCRDVILEFRGEGRVATIWSLCRTRRGVSRRYCDLQKKIQPSLAFTANTILIGSFLLALTYLTLRSDALLKFHSHWSQSIAGQHLMKYFFSLFCGVLAP